MLLEIMPFLFSDAVMAKARRILQEGQRRKAEEAQKEEKERAKILEALRKARQVRQEEARLERERAGVEARRILWECSLRKEATKLEHTMLKCGDTNEADEMERTFYLTVNAVDTTVCSNEMKFVDEITTEMTSLPTFFHHPSLIPEEDSSFYHYPRSVEAVDTTMVEYIPQSCSLTRTGPFLSTWQRPLFTGYGAGFDDDDPVPSSMRQIKEAVSSNLPIMWLSSTLR